MLEELIESNASFSPDRRYRFALWRFWDERPKVMFVCLNPSTADEIKNDATVRRCIAFAHQWGYGGVYVCNIFGLRSTNPKGLFVEPDPVGRGNDLVMITIRKRVEKAVAAWGNHGTFGDRWKRVVENLAPLWCFGLTKLGQPKHPLYLGNNTELEFWK